MLSDSSEMSELRKERNPLWFVMLADVVTLPFDFYVYIIQRFLIVFGVAVIIGKVIGLVLYIRRSRFAWHLALILTAAITPISLLLIHFGFGSEERPHSRPAFEIAISFLLCLYVWGVRERYFRYVRACCYSK
jgi:hypothetical protein